MEKRKKWHSYLIFFVLVFALYNVIPTIIYYSKPLNKTIDSKEASTIVQRIVTKIEKDRGFVSQQVNKLISCLKISPRSVRLLGESKSIVNIELSSVQEAKSLVASLMYGEKTLPVGSLPLFIDNVSINERETSHVTVSSRNFLSISKDQFTFIPKKQNEKISSAYLSFIENKSDQIVYTALNISECTCCEENINVSDQDGFSYLSFIEDLENYEKIFPRKYYNRVIVPFLIRGNTREVKACIRKESDKESSLFSKEFLENILSSCKESSSHENLMQGIEKSLYNDYLIYKFSESSHPLFESIVMDINSGCINFYLNKEVLTLQTSLDKPRLDLLNGLICKEIYKMEKKNLLSGFINKDNSFSARFKGLGKGFGLLVLDNKTLANYCMDVCSDLLRYCWQAKTVDFSSENYPIFFNRQPKKNSPLGCYIFSKKDSCSHFPRESVVIVFKGLHSLVQNIVAVQNETQNPYFKEDLSNLYNLFIKRGFSSQRVHQNQVFYLKNWEDFLNGATKEKFVTLGNHVVLETFDIKHRLDLNNKINTEFHEELVKWHDAYRNSKNRTLDKTYLEVLPVTKNIFYENFKLNIKKYFSGDERKVLKWGLDLSGGKSVKIGFRDKDKKLILNTQEIDRAAEELSQRLNRLGVSEVLVRREGNFVNIDFPCTQNIPAEDLVTASSMKFHVVNEKFSCPESPFYASSKLFLDKVWAIACSQGKYDSLFINKTAKNLLHEAYVNNESFISKQFKVLVDEGLCFPEVEDRSSRDVSNKYSRIIKNKEEREGVNPLTIVYHNYALEGADLANIKTNFDAQEGNILQFSVKRSSSSSTGEKINPSEEFHKWTVLYSTESVSRSELAKYSAGKGWRMAVIFNDLLVTAPQLNSPLKDRAQITGAFSQREVLKLATDLKMGTMTYTPVIMAEDTISPDLGGKQKLQGICAATLGLLAVVIVMCVYYRTAGFIAVIAVILNLLIIWGILQSIGAVLTLSGIAGIILAMGMAVDANVLVFERIREELRLSEGLSNAIKVGYKRAFGAILDSNITTILAALILLFFDIGPVKGFAVTLIIGILSSMFTSLFMTRFFFFYWLEHTQRTVLNMSSLFVDVKLNFIRGAKRSWLFSTMLVVLGVGGLLVGEVRSLLGIDFRGGYVLSLNNIEKEKIFTHRVPQTFNTIGINSRDFQLRFLDQNKKMKIYFSDSGINQLKARSDSVVSHVCDFEYQKDQALSLVVEALQKAGVSFDKNTLSNLHLSWSGVSGQFSKTMQKQAVLGIIGALLIVLVYVCIRFEIAYAVSAVIALVHDLLVTCSILIIAHCFVKSIQFDFQTIGALMTVLGYSLNNTIIIFDRIREQEDAVTDSEEFSKIVKRSINSTFSRTMMTTITTLVVVFSLLLFGGNSLLGFSLTMTSGVVLGVLSSMYLAPALLIISKKNMLSKSKKRNLFQLRK